MAASNFNYTYKPMDYNAAQKQVSGQIDPLFQRAINGVNQQKYASDVQAGQVAAARGLGHSGLAADQLNKIAIATQGQIGDLEAQKASQKAQLANDLVWRDKEFSLQNRGQLYNEWNNNRNYNYQVGRDKVSDNQWNKTYNYNKSVDDRNYKYQVGRDKVTDGQWQKQYNYQAGRDKVNDAWRQKEWSQMSPAEKSKMALEYSYSQRLKKSSGGGGGGGGSSRSRSRSSSSGSGNNTASQSSNKTTTNQTALDRYYSNPIIQNAEKVKKRNPVAKKYLTTPVAPANNKYLSAWDKMKMLGL